MSHIAHGKRNGAHPPEAISADLSVAAIEQRLQATPEGLTTAEAHDRLVRYGPNALPERKVNPVLKFLSYFWGPIAWMIEGAALLSGYLRRWEDFGVIMVLLLLNAVVGFREEYHAGNVVAALKQKLAQSASARRDGKWATLPAEELVPGDVVRLRIGEVIPADAKVLSGDPMEVDQSALTGESLPVERGPGDAVFSGSIVRRGEVEALVYGTGAATFYGKTAQLAEEAQTASHLQRTVLKIGDFLILVAAGLVSVVIIASLFRGAAIAATLQFSLVLLVAAIPAALPTVLSVTMAVGAQTLARRQAIVARLSSVEELASVDVLCSDKTGTLTQNRLAAGAPFLLDGATGEEVMLAAVLASEEDSKDPIDQAVLASEAVVEKAKGYQRLSFVPFDPVRKRTEAAVRGPDGTTLKTSKGAPQVIMELAAKDEATRSQVDAAINDFASHGFRSLGVARSGPDGRWTYLGVIPLSDPPREDSRETVSAIKAMGIDVKMVTGDQVAIAREVAKEVGLGTNIVDAHALGAGAGGKEAQDAEMTERADGFAQVFPEHKYRIVEALQKRGHFVAMTGDGVNDAPALKKADAGIAVSGATDAARAAASIVLLLPGLSVIGDAIRESRRIFQRMNSYATYRIAESIRIVVFVALAVLIFGFQPITALMIVLLAVLNDGAILSISYDNVQVSGKPEHWTMRNLLGVATTIGLMGVVESFLLLYLGDKVFGLSRPAVQTLVYLKLSVAGSLTLYVTRTRGRFWTVRPARILVGAILLAQTVATLLSVYGVFLMTSIGWKWALVVWGYAIAWFFVEDQVKLLAYRMFDPMAAPLMTSLHRTGRGTRLPAP